MATKEMPTETDDYGRHGAGRVITACILALTSATSALSHAPAIEAMHKNSPHSTREEDIKETNERDAERHPGRLGVARGRGSQIDEKQPVVFEAYSVKGDNKAGYTLALKNKPDTPKR